MADGRRRTMKRAIWCLVAAAALAIAGVFAWGYIERHHLQELESACERISRWAEDQSLAPGEYGPSHIPASLTVPGQEATVVRTKAGDTVVLLKTSIGW